MLCHIKYFKNMWLLYYNLVLKLYKKNSCNKNILINKINFNELFET